MDGLPPEQQILRLRTAIALLAGFMLEGNLPEELARMVCNLVGIELDNLTLAMANATGYYVDEFLLDADDELREAVERMRATAEELRRESEEEE